MFQFTKNERAHLSLKEEQGQALVLVILIMLVALTVGVSVSSQALIGSKEAVSEEQSAQAYAVAESGAEIALKHLKTCTEGVDCLTASPVTGSIGGSTYTYTISSASLLASNIYETRLQKDEVVQIDLSNIAGLTSSNNDVKIYFWSDDSDRGVNADTSSNTCSLPDIPDAAIEFIYLAYDTGSNPSYFVREKQVYDSCTVRPTSNNFSASVTGGVIGGYDYDFYAKKSALEDYSFKMNTDDEQRLLRIRSWYNNTWIAVVLHDVSIQFPNQGYEIVSSGTTGENKRTVKVTKSNPYLPAIFDYVLFSGGDLQK
ncbi:hypothetical protein A2X44_01975 [candidate division CPR3 bacterium GWF2_35_18]|uniref:Type 4 fimbrial biogenesis protein PilX N-terminal domain-containing protein n=1 Tax=candidate division CPR3 bacterium GW2011_GWF2_35_18 TaxID=1618350 RepID=A0A0G0BKD2_UNCC3|nr:MAG: hypothetical protein UR67_C0002G0079 [candidate division CPR3 bacterium GW2011_GWF2_35_18]KKP84953.1 MAG: hypothetical protein UR87_C0062G0008 [candidate division CPR3 bacterium GW2011_GWE2_35_7]OGB62767.1 MAG: hypothetical protein A2X44_01975 [candidate division CPR3 bacterium GWF2_35_18]OGB65348.1 MAG: hypothetical protein A2250_00190 [candidate division CPR3 bacterium RIFOXYA2_FULL_35_13]OGB78310.1 MAG: hypothetical protein A2296_02965 [candidate division CPR3 bacterium RIFOXYB2_FULL